jgi:hypothetical protein
MTPYAQLRLIVPLAHLAVSKGQAILVAPQSEPSSYDSGEGWMIDMQDLGWT